MRQRIKRLNLRFTIDNNSTLGYFNDHAIEFHGNMADHSRIPSPRAPYLDVKVFVSGFAVGCKDIVAESREMKDVSIKGLEVEVAPCAAHLPIVSRVSSCRFKAICELLLKALHLSFHPTMKPSILSLTQSTQPPIIHPSCIYESSTDLEISF